MKRLLKIDFVSPPHSREVKQRELRKHADVHKAECWIIGNYGKAEASLFFFSHLSLDLIKNNQCQIYKNLKQKSGAH